MDQEARLRRVTAPGYLEGLADADTAQIRALRDECRSEERRLSYVRRMLQGHLDLAAAEAARRGGDEQPSLVARVARALAGPPGGTRQPARAVGLYEPPPGSDDPPITDIRTIDLPDLDDAELEALLARLRQRERAISDQRAVLLAHLDRLQEALVARYRADRGALEQVATTRDSR